MYNHIFCTYKRKSTMYEYNSCVLCGVLLTDNLFENAIRLSEVRSVKNKKKHMKKNPEVDNRVYFLVEVVLP